MKIPYNAGFENVLQDVRAQMLKKKLSFPWQLYKKHFFLNIASYYVT